MAYNTWGIDATGKPYMYIRINYVNSALAQIAGYHAAGNKGCTISIIIVRGGVRGRRKSALLDFYSLFFGCFLQGCNDLCLGGEGHYLLCEGIGFFLAPLGDDASCCEHENRIYAELIQTKG